VQTASETYFGKEASKLNLAECASLAAITKAPTTYDPLYNPENNKSRQEYCLSEMLSQGVISKKEYDDAVNYKLVFTNSPGYKPKASTDKPVTQTSKYQSFYVDYVINTVVDDLKAKYGYTTQQANNKIYYGGLKIYSAVDLNVQKSMEDVYYNRIAFPKQTDTANNPAVQSAMTVMDYKGRVVGIIGKAGPKVGNRCLNRAVDSPRQPGSSIKPLATYGPAIELNDINWSTEILDYGFPYQNLKLWPQDASGSPGSGKKVTVQYAIQNSLNTVAARIVVDILTPKTCMDYLQNKFHLTTIDPVQDAFAAPMAVGALTKGVTTLEMAAAYAAFGNGGKYYKPFCYYKVTDSTGKDIMLQTKSVGEQILSPDTADIMNELMQTVNTTGFGTGSNVRRSQIFVKTGSTNDLKDRWTCGGTPYYVASVWYGYDKPKYIAGLYPNPAGKVWLAVFDRIHKDLPGKNFVKSGLTVQKRYCTVSGLLAGKYCKSTALGWYKISDLPGTCTTCKGSIIDDINDIIHQIIPGETTTAAEESTTSIAVATTE
jgi:penicillin-binding protein 1A